MKTNLIFKRVVEGRIEMVMVPIEIPLRKEDGWTLASNCDTFDTIDTSTIVSAQSDSFTKEYNTEETKSNVETVEIPAGGKYQSSVPGSARLIRYKNKIQIAYRKGKTTYNQNDPNSVCISDVHKQLFFNSVKNAHGSSVTSWALCASDDEYQHWNAIMDDLYEKGRIDYNKNNC